MRFLADSNYYKLYCLLLFKNFSELCYKLSELHDCGEYITQPQLYAPRGIADIIWHCLSIVNFQVHCG